jgi:hypothetical protein
MPISIPSTSATTLGSVEVLENEATVHYQQFVITDPDGNALGSLENPVPISIADTSTFTKNFNSSDSVVPVAGVHYTETLLNSNSELVNNEVSVLRLTQKGGLKTAGDGRVNEIVYSLATGYDDIYFVEDSFDRNNLSPVTVSGSVFDTSRTNNRFFYIPMIREGWRSLSVSFKTDADSNITFYADVGAVEADISLGTYSLQKDIRYAFIANGTYSGVSIYSIPALMSPFNGIIVEIDPLESVAGVFELHITRGS